ncbi:glycoside hydrolase family 3 N-terminal domain-containing protein [Microbacterium sp. Leaf288]|uniref:glycoside hydrolase family 3 N-terminal domain-containing protein n=1 Tax=Microbacterium sp. Leaf288 TaxID=1736323 RepID=UPI000B110F69|nr:glycoside hydrolase family 3 N-terminal domain-containing protein [Microbacterium sp. Leaf288]
MSPESARPNEPSARTSTDPEAPWRDAALDPMRRAALLLSELSIDEKMAQITCYFPQDIAETDDFVNRHPNGVGVVSTLETRSAETLRDVIEFQNRVQRSAMSRSGHGIPAIFHMEGICGGFLPGATSFPSGLARGASWNPSLERRIGEIVARQERAVGVTHTFAPVLDVSRDPRLGRHGESYGEDPALVSALGVAYAQGIQSGSTGALRSEAVAKHFVGSHHVDGGIHGTDVNAPVRLILEQYAKPFQAAITHAGLRGIMPAYNSVNGQPVSASHWLLTSVLREQMGFDGLVVSDYGAVTNLHSVQRVASSNALAGLLALRAGMDVEQHWPAGFGAELRDLFATGRADVSVLDRAVLSVLAAKFRMGLFEAPYADAASDAVAELETDADRAATLQSARESLVLLTNDGVLPLGRPRRIVVVGCHAASARFFFGGYTHYSMAEAKLATRSSMAGLVTGPSDAGIVTIPGTKIEASDGEEYELLLQHQKPGVRSLLEEVRMRMPDTEVLWTRGYPIAGHDTSGHAEAIELAQTADVVLLTLGGKYGMSSIASMGEGIDATDINLPACQEELIDKLGALGVPLVGVHLDGRPISSDAADRSLSAIIEAWSPSEAGAEAIVDILTGAVGPSGRLPVSVARNAGQVPVPYNHSNGSSWHQGGSIGFPDYVDSPHIPRYPFGHGLSYTKFDYSELGVERVDDIDGEGFQVSFTLANVGERPGVEVVQLYVRDLYASMTRPAQELAGFRRVSLDPGESTMVTFRLAASQFAFLDELMQWRIEPGEVEILVGASSADIRLRTDIVVHTDAVIDGRARAFWAS